MDKDEIRSENDMIKTGEAEQGASMDEASSFAETEEAKWDIKRMQIQDPELQKLQEELFSEEPKTVPKAGGRSRKRKGFFERIKESAGSGMGESSPEEREQLSSLVLRLLKQRMAVIGGLFALIVVLIISVAAASRLTGRQRAAATASEASSAETQETTLSAEELKELELQNTIDNELSTYTDLGIVDVSGYINVRSAPDSMDMTNIIGQLQNGAALSIISQEGDWYQIGSGGITGYASAQYIITGEEALERARDSFADRAIIETEVLNIRSAPTVDAENVIGKARIGERYEVLSVEDEWASIKADFSDSYDEAYIFIGDGNAVVRYCLNEARRLDLREMALTQYDQLVVAATDGFINIREDPSADGIDNICGQFPENAGAELLETVTGEDGNTWYKIRSGGVTGYVRADYCVTGNAARNIAVEAAQLTAYITTDALNVRSEPSLEANAWTQVTRNQSYHVLDQLDGWVEIELDSTDDEGGSDRAFVSTRDNNVEVTYGLPTAIEYYPAIEAANAEMAFRNRIVNYAVQFVGNPYVWGGTSLTNGCDCSGFTQSVLKHFGISIPRVSRDQARVGVRVTSATMRPGDLIFYANSSGTINHVAMYIGNGQVVNAASTRSGIRIYRWNYRTPVAIRDVIGDRTS